MRIGHKHDLKRPTGPEEHDTSVLFEISETSPVKPDEIKWDLPAVYLQLVTAEELDFIKRNQFKQMFIIILFHFIYLFYTFLTLRCVLNEHNTTDQPSLQDIMSAANVRPTFLTRSWRKINNSTQTNVQTKESILSYPWFHYFYSHIFVLLLARKRSCVEKQEGKKKKVQSILIWRWR